MTTVEILLSGVFNPDSFACWIYNRARLLDLAGSVNAKGSTEMCILVQGPLPLIDAMEMACSLGPMDANVERIEVRSTALSCRLNDFKIL